MNRNEAKGKFKDTDKTKDTEKNENKGNGKKQDLMIT